MKIFKRTVALTLAVLMAAALFACGGGGGGSGGGGSGGGGGGAAETTKAAVAETTKAAETTTKAAAEEKTTTTAKAEETTKAKAAAAETTKATQAAATQAAAADTPAVKEPVTFDMLMYGWTTWDEPMKADPVGAWITENTGVYLNVELVTDNYADKASLLLATGDYPEMMMYDETVMRRYIAEGALIDIGEYLDSIPNVVSKYGEWDLNAMRNLDDGKLYKLHQWYMGDYKLPRFGMMLRHDLMIDYFGEPATKKHTFTMADIERFFRDYKAANPTTADGNEIFPLTDENNSFRNHAGQFYGILPYFEVDDQNILPQYLHPKYIDLIKWFALMYRDRILDQEFAINKRENNEQKLTAGASIGVVSHSSDWSIVNTALQDTYGPDVYLMGYYRVTNVPGEEKYLAQGSIGGGGLCITKKCHDIPRMMEFLDFLSEPINNFIIANGLPGGIWDYDENGRIKILQENIDAMPDLWDRFRTYGAYKYQFMINEGVDRRLDPIFDGLVYQPIHNAYGTVDKIIEGRMHYFEGDELVSDNLFSNLLPDPDSREAIIYQAIDDLWKESFPRIIMAPSEAECISLYESTMEAIKAEGLESLMKVMSNTYFKQKKILFGD